MVQVNDLVSFQVLLEARGSDPCGLATKTLANRTLRLSRLVEFRLDIPLPPAASASPSTSAPRGEVKQVLVQARADSLSGGVLRNVLRKYGLELEALVVGFAGTTEVLPSSAPIAKAADRRLYIMSQAQFNEWMHSESGDRNSVQSTGLNRRFPSISSGSSRAESPAASFAPVAAGTSVAELPPKAPAAAPTSPASLAVPSKIKASSLDSEEVAAADPAHASIPGSVSNPSLAEEEPGMLKHVKKAAAGAPLALRKSLEAAAHRAAPTEAAPSAKRQTLANSEELRKQMKQDTGSAPFSCFCLQSPKVWACSTLRADVAYGS